MKNYDDYAKREKIQKKRGKNREALTKGLTEVFDLNPDEWDSYLSKGYFAARVVEVHKRQVFVSTEKKLLEIDTKDVWLATVARKFLQTNRQERNFLAVGDRVLCRPGVEKGVAESSDLPACVIERRAPRTAVISRQDPLNPRRLHLLASNMTQLIIVASYVFPKVRFGLIDRYLCLAEEEGLKVHIILNKEDLLDKLSPQALAHVQEMIKVYQNLGYSVISMSTFNAEDDSKFLRKIEDLFRSEISLVTGHSGVGKSSLVNLMHPEIEQDVEDEEIFRKGRHTTTYASLIRLGRGGYVIDTPGVRSLVLEERGSFDLSYMFRDMRPYIEQCKYRACRHIEEPGCVVLEKLAEGAISQSRYDSYISILTKESRREGRGGQQEELEDDNSDY